MYMYVHEFIYRAVCIHVYLHVHVHIYAYTYVHVHVNIHVYTALYMNSYTAVCMHVYLHVHVLCLCMYNMVLPCTIRWYDVIYCIIVIEVKWLEGIKYKVSHVLVHVCFKYTTIKVIYSSTTVHYLYNNGHMGVLMDIWVY